MFKLTFDKALDTVFIGSILLVVGHIHMRFEPPFQPILDSYVYAQPAPEIVNLRATWTAPTTNEDGSPITDLSHFDMYMQPDVPIADDDISLQPIMTIDGTTESADLPPIQSQPGWKVLHFRLKACDSAGNCSKFSNAAAYVIPDSIAPGVVLDFVITVLPPPPVQAPATTDPIP